jgi:diguanylate cyclase
MGQQFIELQLFKKDARPVENRKVSTLLWLVEQLLQLSAEIPLKGLDVDMDEYRTRLRQFNGQLSEVATAAEAAILAEECIALCRDYQERASQHLLDRETEFNQLVQFLRSTVAELASESSDFQNRLQSSSERFKSLADIQDISELKHLLSKEVSQLKNAIAEKHKREEESHQWMNERIQGLETKLTQARTEATLDALTNVANRRNFDEEIRRWILRHRADERPFALTILDLDNFKTLNDTYGHPVGDYVLQCAAKFFQKNIRSTDFLARYGGEEFVILFENIKLRQAETKMAAMLENLAAQTFVYEAGGQRINLNFTSSCGLAECGARENQWELIMRADGALYEAKKRGKNQVVTTW